MRNEWCVSVDNSNEMVKRHVLTKLQKYDIIYCSQDEKSPKREMTHLVRTSTDN